MRALVESLHALHLVSAGPLAVARRLEIAERVERLCRDAGLDDDLAWPLGWRVDVLFQLGRRPALDNAIERLEEYADRHNNALANWRGKIGTSTIGLSRRSIRGRCPDRRRSARAGKSWRSSGGRFHVSDPRERVSPQDKRRAARTRVRVRPERPRRLPCLSGDARCRSPGDLEKAAALFVLAAPVVHQLDGSTLQVQPTRPRGGRPGMDRGDTAPSIHAALEPFADELGVSTAGQAASLGSVSRYLGQMAALMCRLGPCRD